MSADDLCGWPRGRLRAIAEYAELIAFWISEHDPRCVALADVHACRSERDEAFDLGILVIRSEVEMQPVLVLLDLGHRLKKHPRQLIDVRADLELLRVVVDDDPVERLKPPLTKRNGISSVDDDLLPFNTGTDTTDRAAEPGRSTTSQMAPTNTQRSGAATS